MAEIEFRQALELLADKEGLDVVVEAQSVSDPDAGGYLVLRGRLGKIEMSERLGPHEDVGSAWLPVGDSRSGFWLHANRFSSGKEHIGVVMVQFNGLRIVIS